jgi:uncharacterized phiE125 gp8 family phage protein
MIDNRPDREVTMGLDWSIITDAVAYPVTLVEAKNFIRVDYALDDNLITDIIKAATEQAEKYLNRSITTKTVKFSYTSFSNRVMLPYPPYQSITAVTVKYRGESTVLVADSDYYLSGVKDLSIEFERYYREYELIIDATVGYLSVPLTIKQGVLKLIARMYEYRNDFMEVSGPDVRESFRVLEGYKIITI